MKVTLELTVEEFERLLGGKKKTKEDKKTEPEIAYSQYAKCFDKTSNVWTEDPEYNLMFLKHMELYASNVLRVKGHVFLNEVYEWLGLPKTKAGQIVGWKLGKGDDYVSFGLNSFDPQVCKFINGESNVVVLDFNVDGVILDELG